MEALVPRSCPLVCCEGVIHHSSSPSLSVWMSGLLEERAVLLGRMGKHEQALFIYVHILHNIKMAEE